MTKDEVYAKIQAALTLCTTEGSEMAAVVVLVNTKTDTVQMYGLNMSEEELPELLIDVADNIMERTVTRYTNRVLN